MALGYFSKFYFNYEITIQNYKFDFDEGSGELTAELTLGVYTPTDLAVELKTQLDAAGTKTYTVSFNRNTRVFTVSADVGTFDILISTGTNAGISVYTIFGFNGVVDLTGLGTYLSDPSGSVYYPQYWLQDYVDPSDWLEKVDASVNQSANGNVEVVSFGEINFTEFNILFATNLVMDGRVIKNNPSGVQDLNQFLTFCIKRGPIEFMPDENNVNNFYKIRLETTAANSKAVGYKLKEETGKNLPGIYQSEKLKWRVST
jgi:hypothetical protein